MSDHLRPVLSLPLAVALLALTAAPPSRADGPETTFLWPGAAPGESGDIGPEREQPLRPGDTTIRVTDVTRPSVTVYRPAPAKDTGAAVLICPGGAYNILAFNKEGTEVAEWLNSIGVTGAVLKYRVPARKGRERHAAPLQDAQRALGLLRRDAKARGIDPDRIGVLGFSAGGHLAALLSTTDGARTYDPVDDADQVSCRPDFALLIYPAYLVGNGPDFRLSPELKVTPRTPRTFLVQTQDDGVRAECSLFYYLALKGAKVPSELHLYPDGGHGYGLRPSDHEVSHWPLRAGRWLEGLGVLEKPK
jgi:acetyl esterase/lipase